MFEKLQRAFWKALTPDLIPDQPKSPQAKGSVLNDAMLAALGGSANIKSQQPLALTRLRLELHDPQLLDSSALRVAGVPAVMPLAGGVVHLLLGLQG
ncbi:PTS transporter subunit EIIB [Pseudomonas protegens]|uniref:PTS transporter subunit EIIB n=1 Tax=Pseudomonas protegens TaxID=380021 RepID=UPI002745810A|nr:PTS transporter subunit EIIB [Pseudomonas protegens]MDP9535280.1 PTS transporter subunit EIIB [Pseudomonas protegens]